MIKVPADWGHGKRYFVRRLSSGDYIFDSMREQPYIMAAAEFAAHGDWKDATANMALLKDEQALLVEVWRNLYGEWARVRRFTDGAYLDLHWRQLRVVHPC